MQQETICFGLSDTTSSKSFRLTITESLMLHHKIDVSNVASVQAFLSSIINILPGLEGSTA